MGPPGGVGAAYIFERDSSGTWGPNEIAKLTASDGEYGDSFGRVALFEDNVLVGARGDDSHGLDSGSVYVFLKADCSVWPSTETAKLSPDDGQAGDSFGVVSLWGTVAAIGAPFDDEPYKSGAVYIFSPEVGTPYCFGPDGSCPCGNPAGADEGCANSSGSGAHLCATGSDRGRQGPLGPRSGRELWLGRR